MTIRQYQVYGVLYKTAKTDRNYARISTDSKKRIESLLVSRLEEDNPGEEISLEILATMGMDLKESEESVKLK